ncbi:MAG: glutamine amidotransferase [Pseudomonadota bacterium]
MPLYKRREDDGGGTAAPSGPPPTSALPPLPERRPVLIVLHQEKSTPARIGRWFHEAGFPLDIRRPRFGDQLPETLDDHAAAVIFGGPMSANDPDDYIRRETDWIDVPLREDRPFLGICLGAQMLARKLGATVAPSPQGAIEVGYYPLTVTPAGRVLAPWPEKVYQWHTEGFTMPDGAVRLAGTELYPNQAMSYGRAAAAVQFHPEITYALVNRWTSSRPDRLVTTGARPRDEHFENHMLHTAAVGRWIDAFLTRLLRAELTV